jgi:predicted GIY-YIG superfamily endonuclease
MLMPSITLKEAIKRNYEPTNVQTILFDLDSWTKPKAIKWLNKHGYIHKYHRLTTNQRRFMQHNPVIGASYYSKRLPNGIVIVFQNIDIDGAGLRETFQAVKKKATEFIERVAPLRKSGILPPSSRQLLERIRDEPITSMQVIRTPINSIVNTLLNVISLGQFKDALTKLGYDRAMHLTLFINNKYIFEKNEVINLAQSNPIKSNSETMNVNFKPTTIGKLIEDTRKLMGDQLFTSYNAKTNNCQVFISSILKANGSLTPELNTFINQNAEDIFKRLPQYVDKFATTITDIAARADRFLKGEGVHTLLTKVKRKLDLLKVPYTEVALSNRSTKKIMVVINGRRIHFGAKNSNTFLEGATKQKRDNYRKRHSLIYLKDGRRAIDFKYSPAWLSYYILW